QSLAEKFKNKYSDLVVVGIGGSSLGPKAIAEVFRKTHVHFLDNVDALEFEYLLKRINLQDTCWAFISKSGNTIEVLCALDLVEQFYLQQNISFYERCIAISENKPSSLTQWADRHQVARCEVPLNVGGRFSVLSPVGMFPAAFMGLDLGQFRFGAMQALQKNNLVTEMIAQIKESFEREEWITLLWPYCSRIKFLGMWYQQLWAESLGKKLDLKGNAAPRASTPMCATGSTDQHSILQQVMEGAKDKFIIFLRILDAEAGEIRIKDPQFTETQDLKNKSMGDLLRAEALATQEALNQNGTHSITLKMTSLNEAGLGFLMMYFQLLVSGLGQSMGIDAFNQPGVELGKIIAKQKLSTKG
ncbi:MAG: glucose-6-phosphate isomerase, partial [Pseudobdellovibrionaceae bacterium]